MTDSVAVFDPGWRATDSTGAIVSGAKLKFFDAGTTTPKLVYSNSGLSSSLGSTVTCNSAGYPTSDGTNPCTVFTGTAAYKLVIYQSDGTTQVPGASWDNLKGALDTSTFLTSGSTSTLNTPVTTKSANYTVTNDERGYLINVNVSGGSVTITLPSAVTFGEGYKVGVRHDSIASSNVVSIGTTSAQTIKFRNAAPTTVTLSGCGECVWLVSDGTGWTVDSYVPPIGISTAVLGQYAVNAQLTASVSGNALTVALKDASTGSDPTATTPVYVPFRSTTAGSGATTWRTVTSALSVTAPTSATLGSSSSTAFRLWVTAWDTGSGVVLGLINCFGSDGITALDTNNVASGTAISSGATSAGTHYTSSAQSSKAYAILGYLEWNSGLPSAGTWSGAPDVVAMFGPHTKKPGDVVQVRYSESSGVAVGTTTTPSDDTIPQSTEGDQYLSQAITPTCAANLLRVETLWNGSAGGSSSQFTVALFQDSTANASATVSQGFASTDMMGHWLSYRMRAGTRSSTTFKIRAGAASAGTTTFNGRSSNRILGNTIASFIQVTEISA